MVCSYILLLLPGYEILYLGMKFCAYMKFCTQLWNIVPMCLHRYNFFTRVWNFCI
jgi:hypothetical protein